MASKKGSVQNRVAELVRPALEKLGLRLWDVTYRKQGPHMMLSVFIDRDTPLDTAICEEASRAIDPLLDEADIIQQKYFLEVGSPGLGRRLDTPAHYQAKAGEEAQLGFYQADDHGRKEVRGIIQQADDTGVVLAMEDGEHRYTYKEISLGKLTDDENLFGKE